MIAEHLEGLRAFRFSNCPRISYIRHKRQRRILRNHHTRTHSARFYLLLYNAGVKPTVPRFLNLRVAPNTHALESQYAAANHQGQQQKGCCHRRIYDTPANHSVDRFCDHRNLFLLQPSAIVESGGISRVSRRTIQRVNAGTR